VSSSPAPVQPSNDDLKPKNFADEYAEEEEYEEEQDSAELGKPQLGGGVIPAEEAKEESDGQLVTDREKHKQKVD